MHQLGSVVNQIHQLGLTYLCQPIDVRINKPIKTRLHEKWEDWMTDGEGIADYVVKESSRKMVAEWLVVTYT